MPWWLILIFSVLGLAICVLVFLIVFGRRMQKKQAAAEEQMEATKQQVSILVIDKAKKKLTEAGLPDIVMEQTPKYARRMKMPVVKAKVGTRIMTLMADPKVYEILPVKKTCTVTISGIYITELKAVRGGSVPKPPKKKKLAERLRDKLQKKAAG